MIATDETLGITVVCVCKDVMKFNILMQLLGKCLISSQYFFRVAEKMVQNSFHSEIPAAAGASSGFAGV